MTYILNAYLVNKMQTIKKDILVMLERQLGRKVEYSGISPSIFRLIELRNLVVYEKGSSDKILVKIKRIRVSYSLIKLLQTRDIAFALKRIVIVNSSFVINTENNRDILDFISGISGGKNQTMLSIPRLTGSNIDFIIKKDGESIILKRLFFDLIGTNSKLHLNLRGYADIDTGDFNIQSKVKINGDLNPGELWAELKLRLTSLKSNYFYLKKQTLQISFKKNELQIYKIQDRNPIDISASLNTDSKKLSVKLRAENFVPSSLIMLSGKLKSENRLLNIPVTTESELHYDFNIGSLHYSSNLKTILKGFPGIPEMKISSVFKGDNRRIVFSPLHVISRMGSIVFYGDVLFANYLPSGFLKLIDIHIPQVENLDANINVLRDVQSVTMKSDKLIIGESVFDDFSFKLKPSVNSYNFTLSTQFADTPVPNKIIFKGDLLTGKKVELIGSLSMEKIPPESVFTLQESLKDNSLLYLINKYLVTTDLQLETDFKKIKLVSDNVKMVSMYDKAQEINFGFLLKENRISLTNLKGKIGKNNIRGDITGTYSGLNKIELKSNLVFNDNYYTLDGVYIKNLGLIVKGNHNTNVSVIWGGRATTAVDICTKDLPFTINGQKISLTTCVQGEVTNLKKWYLSSDGTYIKGLDIFQSGKSNIDIDFNIKPNVIQVTSIKYKDTVSQLKGEGELTLNMDLKDPIAFGSKGWLLLKSDNTKESYRLTIEKQMNKIDMNITFRSSPLERFGTFNIQGKLSGNASIYNLLGDTTGGISVTLEEGLLNSDPINLGLDVKYSRKRIQLDSLNLIYLTHNIKDGHGEYDTDKGILSFIANYYADYSGRKVDLILNLDLSLLVDSKKEIKPISLLNIFNTDFKGKIGLSSIKVDKQRYDSWGMNLLMKKRKFTFDGGPGDTIHGLVERDGTFKLIMLAPFPLQGEANGSIKKNIIDADFKVKSFDLLVLNFVMQSDVINFVSGKASGTVSISGPVNDPDFLGLLNVENGIAKSKFSPFMVKPLKTSLLFSGKEFTMQRFNTSVNKKPLTSEGTFFIDHWIPYAFDISFESTGENGIRFSYDFGPLVVDGYVTGSIRVKGDDVATFVDGNITANYSRVSLGEVGKKVSIPDITSPPTVVNLSVKTGKRLEFFWPSFNFPILRAFTELGDVVNIIYDERDGSYSVKGEVGIQGGEVFYFDRSFYLKNGKITFNENQENFDPIVQVLAEIREQDKNGMPVKIYLESNSKISEFSPRFYSEPPRPDVEILSMIGGSIFNKVQKQGVGISAVLLTSELVSQFGILRPFENAVRDFLGLDLFSIRTQIIQNILLEKILGNVSNPLDNTTLSLGKYLGNDIFLEMLVRFKTLNIPFEDINYFTGLSSDLELSLEWTTPFFLMEWSLIPKHPETLFLSDNALTLKWKYSY